MGRKLRALKESLGAKGTEYAIEDAKSKLRHAKEDKGIVLLVAVELLLVFVLVAAIIVYFDPEINLLPKGIPNVLEYAGFAVLVVVIIYTYNRIAYFTELLRQKRAGKKGAVRKRAGKKGRKKKRR